MQEIKKQKRVKLWKQKHLFERNNETVSNLMKHTLEQIQDSQIIKHITHKEKQTMAQQQAESEHKHRKEVGLSVRK